MRAFVDVNGDSCAKHLLQNDVHEFVSRSNIALKVIFKSEPDVLAPLRVLHIRVAHFAHAQVQKINTGE